jgi:hypothetical protein
MAGIESQVAAEPDGAAHQRVSGLPSRERLGVFGAARLRFVQNRDADTTMLPLS